MDPTSTHPVARYGCEIPRSADPSEVDDRGRVHGFVWTVVPIAFVVLMVLQLCLPIPQGPGDSGDFYRMAMAFSTGPAGFPMFPRPGDVSREARFLTYYHRYWRLDEWKKPLPSSSVLLVLPSAWLMRSAGFAHFDLALHTGAVFVALACVLALTLRSLHDSRAVAFLAILAFVPFSDPVVAGYVNSFYQESGTYVFLFLLLAAGHLLWERETLPRWIAVMLVAMLLMVTKPAYTWSVGIAILPLLLVVGLRSVALPAWRKAAFGVAGAGLMALFTFVASRLVDVPEYEKCHSYDFIFTGALPRLSPDDRASYLRAIGLDEGLVEAGGISYFEVGSRYDDPPVNELLGWELHHRAVLRLVTAHPGAAARLFLDGMAASGIYTVPWLGYREHKVSDTRQPPGGLKLWSTLRARWLGGATAYAVAAGLLLLVTFSQPLSRHSWSAFSVVIAGGFYCASLSQLAVSVVGDGATDLFKHNYFANLLLDCALVLTFLGNGLSVLSGEE